MVVDMQAEPGPVRLLGNPLKLSRTPVRYAMAPAAGLRADTETVLNATDPCLRRIPEVPHAGAPQGCPPGPTGGVTSGDVGAPAGALPWLAPNFQPSGENPRLIRNISGRKPPSHLCVIATDINRNPF